MLSHSFAIPNGPRYLDEAASLAVNDHPADSVLAAQRHLEEELRASRAQYRPDGAWFLADPLDTTETWALLETLQGHGTAGTALTALALAEHLERHSAAVDGSRRIGRDEALLSISLVSDLLEVGEVDMAGLVPGGGPA